jgi:hypothetical protein
MLGRTHPLQRVFELDRVKVDLQNARRQCEAMKILLNENTTEKDIMYEVNTSFMLSEFTTNCL